MKLITALCLAAGSAVATASQKPLAATNTAPIATSDFTTFRSSHTPHELRIKPQNDSICDARSAQYTGWLDIGHKHFFYWYFESRNDPKNDPLLLWLTGGPGGSSMIGMLQELGPCIVNDFGNGTVHNPWGWSANANIVFLDQPAGVGFSYVDKHEPLVDNSFSGAEDVHAFLQLFVGKAFPHLAESPFHITGESYGGHYIPTLGAEIVKQNTLRPHHQQINLKSVAIGNGLISSGHRVFGYWETLCTTNPGVEQPIFNSTRCDIMAKNIPRCMSLLEVCYANPDVAICKAAEQVCWEGVISLYDSESKVGGRNRFDITRPCEGDDEGCYVRTVMLEKYLNTPRVFSALSVPAEITHYNASSMPVNEAFEQTNDIAISTEPQVQYLLASQVDVLIYQGKLDVACSTAGNYKWAGDMPWRGQAAFNAEKMAPWTSNARDGGKEKKAGEFKEVAIQMKEGDERKTRFAFVTVDDAGHLVPQDQPEISLDLLTRWLNRESFRGKTVAHEEL